MVVMEVVLVILTWSVLMIVMLSVGQCKTHQNLISQDDYYLVVTYIRMHAIAMGFPAVSSLELCSGNSQPSSCAAARPSQRSQETIFRAQPNQINRTEGNNSPLKATKIGLRYFFLWELFGMVVKLSIAK